MEEEGQTREKLWNSKAVRNIYGCCSNSSCNYESCQTESYCNGSTN